MLLVCLLSCISNKIGKCVSLVLTFILLVVLVADTFVYQQYHFHINWPMIDLAIVGGRDVFPFSTEMIRHIARLSIFIAFLTFLLLWLSDFLQQRIKVHYFCFVILFGYAIANCAHAYGAARNVRSILVLTERIPLYYPLRANQLLARFGFVKHEHENLDLNLTKFNFRYPLNAINYGNSEKLNVLIVAIDSLRSDVVNPSIMPNLTKIAKNGIQFHDHYSAGNATRSGIFGLFYGLPPFYWQAALSSSTSPVLMNGFIDSGYDIGVFSTATLNRPEFYSTVFSRVKPLRMGSTGSGSVIDRDFESVDDFEK